MEVPYLTSRLCHIVSREQQKCMMSFHTESQFTFEDQLIVDIVSLHSRILFTLPARPSP